MRFKNFNICEKKKQWGQTCTSLNQVAEVFTNYISGKIKRFPFCEGAFHEETDIIRDELLLMNKNKLFTINSQPRLNGIKSTDEKFGWGSAKGYVY